MKHLTFFLFLTFLTIVQLSAKETVPIFSKEDSVFFSAKQDTIAAWGDFAISDASVNERQLAVYEMIKGFKTMLARENSYHYRFDKLSTVSQLYAPDNRFRLFTWTFRDDKNNFRYYGLIQMNESKLKMFPLVDYSSFIDNPQNTVLGNDRWLGALYYDIVLKSDQKGKPYYTLFGWDGSSVMSSKKWMEVLWFTENGEPRFGAPVFDFGKDTIITRFILQFKQDAIVNLKYDLKEDQVVFDHLIPLDGNSFGFFFNYVPDGSYSAFKWEKGKWKYIDKLTTIKLKDGEFPVGNTLPSEY